MALERNTQNDDVIIPEVKPIQITKEPEGKKCC